MPPTGFLGLLSRLDMTMTLHHPTSPLPSHPTWCWVMALSLPPPFVHSSSHLCHALSSPIFCSLFSLSPPPIYNTVVKHLEPNSDNVQSTVYRNPKFDYRVCPCEWEQHMLKLAARVHLFLIDIFRPVQVMRMYWILKMRLLPSVVQDREDTWQ